jgi:hypothetical protein
MKSKKKSLAEIISESEAIETLEPEMRNIVKLRAERAKQIRKRKNIDYPIIIHPFSKKSVKEEL